MHDGGRLVVVLEAGPEHVHDPAELLQSNGSTLVDLHAFAQFLHVRPVNQIVGVRALDLGACGSAYEFRKTVMNASCRDIQHVGLVRRATTFRTFKGRDL